MYILFDYLLSSKQWLHPMILHLKVNLQKKCLYDTTLVEY